MLRALLRSSCSRFEPILVAFVAMTSGQASAHPHSFIDASVEVVFDADGKLSAVHQKWTFDNEFGDALRVRGDVNQDQALDASELGAIGDSLARGFAPYHHYTHVVVDGVAVALGAATDAEVSLEDYRLHYEFTMPLATPAAIESGAGIDIADFDVNFAVAWVSPPLRAVNLPPGCSLIRRDREPDDPAFQTLLARSGVHSLEPDPAAGYPVRAVIGCF